MHPESHERTAPGRLKTSQRNWLTKRSEAADAFRGAGEVVFGPAHSRGNAGRSGGADLLESPEAHRQKRRDGRVFQAFPSEAARSTLPGGREPKMGNPGVIEVKANERTH